MGCFLDFSDSSLFVFGNGADFCILILYPAALLNSLMSPSFVFFFFVCFLFFGGIFRIICVQYHVICKHWQFYIFLANLDFFKFVNVVWLLWLGLPKLCWIKVVRVGIVVLFLILEEMLSFSSLSFMLVIILNGLGYVRYIPFMLTFGKVFFFYHK